MARRPEEALLEGVATVLRPAVALPAVATVLRPAVALPAEVATVLLPAAATVLPREVVMAALQGALAGLRAAATALPPAWARR